MGEIHAFSAEHVRRLTGLSEHQLRYWDRTGLFSPAAAAPDRTPYRRAYSMRDLLGLRVLAELRNRFAIPLQELRRAGELLQRQVEHPWSEMTFYVVGKQVYIQRPGEAAVQAALPGSQRTLQIELTPLAGTMQGELGRLRARAVTDVGKVVRRRYVAGGQPVLAGTRMPTRAIWEFYTAGHSRNAIGHEYPELTPRNIDVAIAFEQKRLARAS